MKKIDLINADSLEEVPEEELDMISVGNFITDRDFKKQSDLDILKQISKEFGGKQSEILVSQVNGKTKKI